MKLIEILRLVWVNILENKFKVMLTSLGIIVGSATIVMVIAIGRGGQADVADQFKNLNAGTIEISTAAASTRGSSGGSSGGGMMGGMPSMGGGMPSGGGNRGGSSGGGMPSFGGGASGRAPGFGGGGMPSFGGGMPDFGSMPDFGAMMGGMPGFGSIPANVQIVTFTKEDADDIEFFVPNLDAVSIVGSEKKEVLSDEVEEAISYTVAGVEPSYLDICNLELAVGSFLTEENDEMLEKVVVLGAKAAEELFGSAMAAFDSNVVIDNTTFVVNGVLETMGTVTSGISPDTAVYVPYATAKKYLLDKSVNPTITAVATEVKYVEGAIKNIETVLKQSYPSAEFQIKDAGAQMEAATQSADTLSMLLIAVASIVFVVGGIGIMNVLFVSVQERTREIGVLKAIGASKRDILLEFLFEAMAISIFGGVVGVGASLLLEPVVAYSGMRLEMSVYGVVLALAFAIVTGTVFGFYPAYKASALIPIEALNQE